MPAFVDVNIGLQGDGSNGRLLKTRPQEPSP